MSEHSVVDNTTTNTPEVIAEAVQYGWVPKEKFRGKETEWVDAAEYVKRGRSSIPILRTKLTAAEGKVNQLLQTVSQHEQDMTMVRKIGYDQATKEWTTKYEALKAAKAAALEASDHAGVVTADELIADHKEVKPAAPTKAAPQISPEETQWLADNPWYKPNADDSLTIAANAIGAQLAKGGKGLQGVALLNAVREKMEEMYPEELGVEDAPAPMTHNTRRRTAASTAAAAHSYDNLPDDAKKACDRLVGKKHCTREEYVANYQWED